MDDTFALRRQIKDLREQLASLRTERDLAQVDRQCAVAQLAHAYQLKRDPIEVPVTLVHALRSVSEHSFQGVWLAAGGHEIRALVDGAGYDADPGAEGAVWGWLVDHGGTPPRHPFTRKDMPGRLFGMAWPDGQIVVSSALSGRDVVAAHRALRPRRHGGLLRALGLLLIPGPAARTALGLLRDAQATASAATTAAATTSLPAVTAAAISCTTLTACAPPISMAAPDPRPVAVAQHIPAAATTRAVPAPSSPTRPRRLAVEDAEPEKPPALDASAACCPAPPPATLTAPVVPVVPVAATPTGPPLITPTPEPAPEPVPETAATTPEPSPEPADDTEPVAPGDGAQADPAPTEPTTGDPRPDRRGDRAGHPHRGKGHHGHHRNRGRHHGRHGRAPHRHR